MTGGAVDPKAAGLRLSASRAEFLSSVLLAARAVTPVAIPAVGPVIVAQALLESRWGEAAIGGTNLFGVKARDGEPHVWLDTTEYVAGKPKRMSQKFRVYASVAEAMRVQVELLTKRKGSSGRPIYSRALQHPTDPAAFARSLTGVYATDPRYGEKLVRLMADYRIPQRFGFEFAAAAPGASAWRWPVALLLVGTLFVGLKL